MTPPGRAGNFGDTLHMPDGTTPERRLAGRWVGNGTGDAIVPIAPKSPRKSIAIVSLVFHLVMAAVAPSLDGTLEAAIQDRQVHVEAPGDDPCAPLHDHLTCQLCRIAERGALASTPLAAILETAPVASLLIVTEGMAPHGAADLSPRRQRAPPAV